MAKSVMPLHYVTLEYRFHAEDEKSLAIATSGKHRFLYGVESWIDGVDQQLESLSEGESLALLLEPKAAAFVAGHLMPQYDLPEMDERFALDLKVVEVARAEPVEVTKALAASVKCCDHCGDY